MKYGIKMRKIKILCDGGLGNRLGVLIGGLITGEKINAEPVIYWPENSWCGCAFDDLFDTELNFINEDINTLFKNNIDNLFMIHENQTNLILKKIYVHSERNVDILSKLNDDIVYYNNSIPSYYNKSKIIETLSSIKIKESIVNEVLNFCKQNNIDENTDGVHFRKTDFTMGINEDKIFKFMISNMNKKYYICSDDKETEDRFRKLKNVISYQKTSYVEKLKDGSWNEPTTDLEGRTFNYNVNRPKQSVIEAFIDLLILSRTNILVNSLSTFLTFAKYYSKIKL